MLPNAEYIRLCSYYIETFREWERAKGRVYLVREAEERHRQARLYLSNYLDQTIGKMPKRLHQR